MGWGSDSIVGRGDGVGWGREKKVVNLPTETQSGFEKIKSELQTQGAVLADMNDGDYSITFQGDRGLLFERQGVVYVYTEAQASSPLGKLLSENGVSFSPAPKGGWEMD